MLDTTFAPIAVRIIEVKAMIDLKMSGCCYKCEDAELSLVKFGESVWVRCAHERVCGALKEEKQVRYNNLKSKGADDEMR